MLIHIGADLETTPGICRSVRQSGAFLLQELGKRNIFICPDLNYSAGIHATKWIPILPNTDAALQLAIAYVWITEGTYDKEYVKTHVVGFEEFSDYVMGKEDGEPKTPEWAAKKTGVSEWTIKALAREWASTITSTIHYYGGSYIRGPYSHEPSRLECCLMGMQGLGRPGTHVYAKLGDGLSQIDLPKPKQMLDLVKIRTDVWTGRPLDNLTKQIIRKPWFNHQAFTSALSHWAVLRCILQLKTSLKHYQYPIPKEGGRRSTMIWMDNPCRIPAGTMLTRRRKPSEAPRSNVLLFSIHGWRMMLFMLISFYPPIPSWKKKISVCLVSVFLSRASLMKNRLSSLSANPRATTKQRVRLPRNWAFTRNTPAVKLSK
jgi:trimethylamine-N-oxide reductase (cytochrome c)